MNWPLKPCLQRQRSLCLFLFDPRHFRRDVLQYLIFKHQHFAEYIIAKQVRTVTILVSVGATSFSDCTLLLTPSVDDTELEGQEMETDLKLTASFSLLLDVTKFEMRHSGRFTTSEVEKATIVCKRLGDLVELRHLAPGAPISELVHYGNFRRRVRARVE